MPSRMILKRSGSCDGGYHTLLSRPLQQCIEAVALNVHLVRYTLDGLMNRSGSEVREEAALVLVHTLWKLLSSVHSSLRAASLTACEIIAGNIWKKNIIWSLNSVSDSSSQAVPAHSEHMDTFVPCLWLCCAAVARGGAELLFTNLKVTGVKRSHLRDKAADILYLCYCQQMPSKYQNRWCNLPLNTLWFSHFACGSLICSECSIKKKRKTGWLEQKYFSCSRLELWSQRHMLPQRGTRVAGCWVKWALKQRTAFFFFFLPFFFPVKQCLNKLSAFRPRGLITGINTELVLVSTPD